MGWRWPKSPTDFDVRVRRGAGYVVVALTGELDLATAPRLEKQVARLVDEHQRLVVDLSELRLCDACGMTALVRAAGACADRDGWLRLAAPRGVVRRVFAIVAFGGSVPTYATVAAAATGDESRRIKD